jgi:hypothetical protein
MVDPKYKADLDEGVNLTNAYARAISKSYNFYTADPSSTFIRTKKTSRITFPTNYKRITG